MKKLFVSLFVANLVLGAVSFFLLPERVAIHFGAGGMADAWGSRNANALLMTGVYVLLFAAIYFSPGLVRKAPGLVNLPNKAYWLIPERQSLAVEKMRGFLWQFGAALFGFLLVLEVLTLQANLFEPARLDMRVFLPALGAFLVYAVWWTIAFSRAFRIPPVNK